MAGFCGTPKIYIRHRLWPINKMKLYIVATPIGNLEDISFRALKILKEVDYILCEDTLHSLKLLNYYQIQKPLISYHQYSQLKRIKEIINLLKKGKNLALISDAGTPGISDPGNELVKLILKEIPETEIIPVPGPNAAIALLSISGFRADKFLFLGFPPAKNKRRQFFEEIINSKYPVLFYESPFRILKSLTQLAEIDNTLEVVVGKELTKLYEKIYRGNILEVIKKMKNDGIKGEYVVMVSKSREINR